MRLVLLIAFFLLQPASVMADELTERKVKSFYKTQGKIASGKMLNTNKNVSFWQKHATEDSIFSVAMGADDLEKPMVQNLNKKQLIEMLSETYKDIRDAKSKAEIIEININENKQEAVVKYKFIHKSMRLKALPDGGGLSKIPYESSSDCIDRVVLQNTIVQTQNSDCNSSFVYGEPEIVEKE